MRAGKTIFYEGKEWTANSLAKHLGIPNSTFYRWLHKGIPIEKMIKNASLKNDYEPMSDEDPSLFEGCTEEQIKEMMKYMEEDDS